MIEQTERRFEITRNDSLLTGVVHHIVTRRSAIDGDVLVLYLNSSAAGLNAGQAIELDRDQAAALSDELRAFVLEADNGNPA